MNEIIIRVQDVRMFYSFIVFAKKKKNVLQLSTRNSFFTTISMKILADEVVYLTSEKHDLCA